MNTNHLSNEIYIEMKQWHLPHWRSFPKYMEEHQKLEKTQRVLKLTAKRGRKESKVVQEHLQSDNLALALHDCKQETWTPRSFG